MPFSFIFQNFSKFCHVILSIFTISHDAEPMFKMKFQTASYFDIIICNCSGFNCIKLILWSNSSSPIPENRILRQFHTVDHVVKAVSKFESNYAWKIPKVLVLIPIGNTKYQICQKQCVQSDKSSDKGVK